MEEAPSLSPSTTATFDKLTFGTDTTAAVPGTNLSEFRENLGAAGNETSGYFGGGGPSGTTRMDKVTHSTETVVYTPGANLSNARRYPGATGNKDAGYFGGGRSSTTNFTTMDKITYSGDTTAAVPGANLSDARYSLNAVGNATDGYFTGGLPSFSLIDKITYSSDTTARLPGTNLVNSSGIFGHKGTGNSDVGYFGGGNSNNSPISTTQKITYSTDTTAAVPGGSLSAARYNAAATGNQTHGYFGGGSDYPSPNVYSIVDKLTYSSETTAATPSANLSTPRSKHAAVADFGLLTPSPNII